MKTSFKVILLTCILATISLCEAQNHIVAIDASRSETPNGAYFKDLNNEFNKFEGVWEYNNGNTYFKLVLQKKEQININGDYRDILIGEYQYIENGIELINTLPLLPLNINDIKNTNVGGSSIININQIIKCIDCSPDERRIKLYITDPERTYLNYSIILRYIHGQTSSEKMTITLYAEEGGLIPNEDSPTTLRLPNGEYLMEKQ